MFELFSQRDYVLIDLRARIFKQSKSCIQTTLHVIQGKLFADDYNIVIRRYIRQKYTCCLYYIYIYIYVFIYACFKYVTHTATIRRVFTDKVHIMMLLCRMRRKTRASTTITFRTLYYNLITGTAIVMCVCVCVRDSKVQYGVFIE